MKTIIQRGEQIYAIEEVFPMIEEEDAETAHYRFLAEMV